MSTPQLKPQVFDVVCIYIYIYIIKPWLIYTMQTSQGNWESHYLVEDYPYIYIHLISFVHHNHDGVL